MISDTRRDGGREGEVVLRWTTVLGDDHDETVDARHRADTVGEEEEEDEEGEDDNDNTEAEVEVEKEEEEEEEEEESG